MKAEFLRDLDLLLKIWHEEVWGEKKTCMRKKTVIEFQ